MAPQYVCLNDYGSHRSTICPPQRWWLPWIHTLSHSLMMDPVSPSSLSLLNDDVYLMMKRRWWENCLCAKGWLLSLEDDCQKHTRRVRIRRYITTLAPSSSYPWARQFSCYLFNDILTRTPFNLQLYRLLPKVSQITYFSTNMDKCLLEDVRLWRGVSWRMELVESSVVMVPIRMFNTAERILSYKLPRLMIRAALLTELDGFVFYFNSSCFLIFLTTIHHWASFTTVMYIPE